MKKAYIVVTSIVAVSVIGLAFNTACSAKKNKTVQTVSAYLDQDGIVVDTTVDISDGYSCDFARGAVYLYDSASQSDSNLVAIGMTLDKEVYDEYAGKAQADSSHREVKDGIIFDADGQTGYLCPVGDSAYFAIFSETASKDQMTEIANRFTVAPEV